MGSYSEDRFRDEFEIKGLLTRERYYRDTQQWQKLREAYHPDDAKTLIDIAWYKGGADGFVSGSEEMSRNGTNAIHTITPVEIQFNGDKALSESVGNIRCRYEVDGDVYICLSSLRFISRLERTNAGWRMLTLEAIYELDQLGPVASINPPKHCALDPKLRKSYCCVSWLLSKQGYSMNQNLAGTDRPETVQQLMDEGFGWLSAA